MIQQSPSERAVKVCPQCEGEGGYPDGLDEAACHTECTRCGGNGWIVDLDAIASQAAQPAEADGVERLCEDCPPVGYPTDKTRCDPCPRAATPKAPATDAGEVEITARQRSPIVADYGENYLVARVSNDGKLVGIDHPCDAVWSDVMVAHVALRDYINERIARQDACPFKAKALATPPAPNDDLRAAERQRIIGEARRNLALTQGCMECNAEDERRWQETIEWLEKLA